MNVVKEQQDEEMVETPIHGTKTHSQTNSFQEIQKSNIQVNKGGQNAQNCAETANKSNQSIQKQHLQDGQAICLQGSQKSHSSQASLQKPQTSKKGHSISVEDHHRSCSKSIGKSQKHPRSSNKQADQSWKEEASEQRKATSFCVQEIQHEEFAGSSGAVRQNRSGLGAQTGDRTEEQDRQRQRQRQGLGEEDHLTASIVVEIVRPAAYSLSQNSLNHSSLEFTGVQNTTTHDKYHNQQILSTSMQTDTTTTLSICSEPQVRGRFTIQECHQQSSATSSCCSSLSNGQQKRNQQPTAFEAMAFNNNNASSQFNEINLQQQTQQISANDVSEQQNDVEVMQDAKNTPKLQPSIQIQKQFYQLQSAKSSDQRPKSELQVANSNLPSSSILGAEGVGGTCCDDDVDGVEGENRDTIRQSQSADNVAFQGSHHHSVHGVGVGVGQIVEARPRWSGLAAINSTPIIQPPHQSSSSPQIQTSLTSATQQKQQISAGTVVKAKMDKVSTNSSDKKFNIEMIENGVPISTNSAKNSKAPHHKIHGSPQHHDRGNEADFAQNSTPMILTNSNLEIQKIESHQSEPRRIRQNFGENAEIAIPQPDHIYQNPTTPITTGSGSGDLMRKKNGSAGQESNPHTARFFSDSNSKQHQVYHDQLSDNQNTSNPNLIQEQQQILSHPQVVNLSQVQVLPLSQNNSLQNTHGNGCSSQDGMINFGATFSDATAHQRHMNMSNLAANAHAQNTPAHFSSLGARLQQNSAQNANSTSNTKNMTMNMNNNSGCPPSQMQQQLQAQAQTQTTSQQQSQSQSQSGKNNNNSSSGPSPRNTTTTTTAFKDLNAFTLQAVSQNAKLIGASGVPQTIEEKNEEDADGDDEDSSAKKVDCAESEKQRERAFTLVPMSLDHNGTSSIDQQQPQNSSQAAINCSSTAHEMSDKNQPQNPNSISNFNKEIVHSSNPTTHNEQDDISGTLLPNTTKITNDNLLHQQIKLGQTGGKIANNLNLLDEFVLQQNIHQSNPPISTVLQIQANQQLLSDQQKSKQHPQQQDDLEDIKQIQLENPLLTATQRLVVDDYSAGEAGDEGNPNDAESDLENFDNKSLAARKDSEQIEYVHPRRERLNSSFPNEQLEEYGAEDLESPALGIANRKQVETSVDDQNDKNQKHSQNKQLVGQQDQQNDVDVDQQDIDDELQGEEPELEENQNDNEDVYNASRNSDTTIEDSGSVKGAVTELGWKPSRLKKTTVQLPATTGQTLYQQTEILSGKWPSSNALKKQNSMRRVASQNTLGLPQVHQSVRMQKGQHLQAENAKMAGKLPKEEQERQQYENEDDDEEYTDDSEAISNISRDGGSKYVREGDDGDVNGSQYRKSDSRTKDNEDRFLFKYDSDDKEAYSAASSKYSNSSSSSPASSQSEQNSSHSEQDDQIDLAFKSEEVQKLKESIDEEEIEEGRLLESGTSINQEEEGEEGEPLSEEGSESAGSKTPKGIVTPVFEKSKKKTSIEQVVTAIGGQSQLEGQSINQNQNIENKHGSKKVFNVEHRQQPKSLLSSSQKRSSTSVKKTILLLRQDSSKAPKIFNENNLSISEIKGAKLKNQRGIVLMINDLKSKRFFYATAKNLTFQKQDSSSQIFVCNEIDESQIRQKQKITVEQRGKFKVHEKSFESLVPAKLFQPTVDKFSHSTKFAAQSSTSSNKDDSSTQKTSQWVQSEPQKISLQKNVKHTTDKDYQKKSGSSKIILQKSNKHKDNQNQGKKRKRKQISSEQKFQRNFEKSSFLPQQNAQFYQYQVPYHCQNPPKIQGMYNQNLQPLYGQNHAINLASPCCHQPQAFLNNQCGHQMYLQSPNMFCGGLNQIRNHSCQQNHNFQASQHFGCSCQASLQQAQCMSQNQTSMQNSADQKKVMRGMMSDYQDKIHKKYLREAQENAQKLLGQSITQMQSQLNHFGQKLLEVQKQVIISQKEVLKRQEQSKKRRRQKKTEINVKMSESGYRSSVNQTTTSAYDSSSESSCQGLQSSYNQSNQEVEEDEQTDQIGEKELQIKIDRSKLQKISARKQREKLGQSFQE